MKCVGARMRRALVIMYRVGPALREGRPLLNLMHQLVLAKSR
jgi:hypothetical protein